MHACLNTESFWWCQFLFGDNAALKYDTLSNSEEEEEKYDTWSNAEEEEKYDTLSNAEEEEEEKYDTLSNSEEEEEKYDTWSNAEEEEKEEQYDTTTFILYERVRTV